MISLPYPISANVYWRNFRGRMVVSKEAEIFKRVAASQAIRAGITHAMSGAIEICIQLHPKMTKAKGKGAAGQPRASKTRVDLDNALKVTIDSLIGIAYEDDNQIERISAEIGQPFEGGGLSVWVSQIEDGGRGSMAPIEGGTA
jgi:crossover junction endodeoxyribonuclease RusA